MKKYLKNIDMEDKRKIMLSCLTVMVMKKKEEDIMLRSTKEIFVQERDE